MHVRNWRSPMGAHVRVVGGDGRAATIQPAKRARGHGGSKGLAPFAGQDSPQRGKSHPRHLGDGASADGESGVSKCSVANSALRSYLWPVRGRLEYRWLAGALVVWAFCGLSAFRLEAPVDPNARQLAAAFQRAMAARARTPTPLPTEIESAASVMADAGLESGSVRVGPGSPDADSPDGCRISVPSFLAGPLASRYVRNPSSAASLGSGGPRAPPV